ncbi:sulfurtransferase TusA family protein [Ferrimonas pelagia]
MSGETVDLRQLRCPLAFVHAKLAIQARADGKPLTLLISDPGTAKDVPRWLDKIGSRYEWLEAERILRVY